MGQQWRRAGEHGGHTWARAGGFSRGLGPRSKLGRQHQPTEIAQAGVSEREAVEREAVPSVEGFRDRLLVAPAPAREDTARPRMANIPGLWEGEGSGSGWGWG